jgi:hypothetical protein
MDPKSNIDDSKPGSFDDLVKDIWFGWEERCPEQAAVVRQVVDDKIASFTFTQEGLPGRFVCRLVWNDTRKRPLELFAFVLGDEWVM